VDGDRSSASEGCARASIARWADIAMRCIEARGLRANRRELIFGTSHGAALEIDDESSLWKPGRTGLSRSERRARFGRRSTWRSRRSPFRREAVCEPARIDRAAPRSSYGRLFALELWRLHHRAWISPSFAQPGDSTDLNFCAAPADERVVTPLCFDYLRARYG
jgi:hypothetical protein